LTVTEFSVTPFTQDISLQGFCATECPTGSSSTCPPRQQVRSLAVSITARSSADPNVQRSLNSSVRLRNDALRGACPA
jgi:prepilin peptidase dependent protein B